MTDPSSPRREADSEPTDVMRGILGRVRLVAARALSGGGKDGLRAAAEEIAALIPERLTADVAWRCFYCDEVFVNEQHAAEHFGESRGSLAGCQIKGHEHNLLRIVREQEEELAKHRGENTEFIRAMESMRYEHAQDMRRAEEAGYAKAVREMQRLAANEFGREISL